MGSPAAPAAVTRTRRRRGLSALLSLPFLLLSASANASPATSPAATGPAARPEPPKLVLHVGDGGWGGDDRDDVEAVLRSAARELLPYFPGVSIEPIRVSPGGGPITYFKRSDDGCVVMKLDTGGSYWSQYAFQFGHELCHVLCRFREGDVGNKWLEESICETSSLFVCRRMAETWKTEAPYPNWKSYAPHLKEYADRRIAESRLPAGRTLAAWYADNAGAMRGNGEDRPRDRVVAVALLPLFEAEPWHWAAVNHLNDERPETPEALEACLRRWHDHTPPEHRAFVRAVGKELGVVWQP